ncbi:hypothetical protein [Streptomyces sp. TLI_053]|uniref:hypothetical protein n=1 Tax=Streptomyces sp. TLI_053 TaxID=1855352 RepID=UPI0013520AB1|nr:hypothetical protein [Streptomyces sp. TLI_053]
MLLTDSHCGTSDTYRTGAGAVVGDATDADTALDATVITVTGVSGRFYDGAWSNTAGYAKRVVGAGRNHVGDLVCTSGSMSGVHCSLRITATDVSADGMTGVVHDALIGTEPLSGPLASADPKNRQNWFSEHPRSPHGE